MELTKVKLSDVARVEISGVDKKSKPGQKSVRLCNFVDVYHNWAITQDMRDSFMEATASDKEIEALSIKKGQVAFTKDSETRDDIGIPTYIADDFDGVVLGYHNALITPDERKLNGKYLNAFMHSSYIQKYFENNASGSGQRYTLSNDTVNSIPILLPTIKEQEKIGNLFSFIDRKIALNKKMNQKLEAMAKRLYDYWFVQYDFPDKNGRPYKTTDGPMTYNPTLKREIPAGWEVSNICPLMEILPGGTPSKAKPEFWNGDIPFFGPTDYCGDVFQLSTEEHITENGLNNCASALYPPKTIFITARGSVGKLIVCGKPMAMNQSCYALKPFDLEKYEYLFYLTKQLIEQLKKKGSGSVFKSINTLDIEQSFLSIAPNEIIDLYCKKVKSIFERIKSNTVEIAKLTALRDKLLPLLMNGQVTIK